MIQYCTICLLPETKPDLKFDEKGVCSACTAYKNRAAVDWDARQLEFDSVISKFKSKSVSKWDCIIPVSGGKDSTAQVLKILEYPKKCVFWNYRLKFLTRGNCFRKIESSAKSPFNFLKWI